MQVEFGEIGAKKSSICDFWWFAWAVGKRKGPPIEAGHVARAGVSRPSLDQPV
jgi:hypothetical protein